MDTMIQATITYTDSRWNSPNITRNGYNKRYYCKNCGGQRVAAPDRLCLCDGDHREATCRQLGEAIPCTYQQYYSFSDCWQAYANGFGTETQQGVGKETVKTAHQERWYNTLRQWLGRDTRQTLSLFQA